MFVSILDRPPYMNITRILSNKTRLLLIKTIENLDDLFSKMQHVEANTVTTRIVDRYFAYLERSCRTPQLVNRRAAWLLIYAQSVYIHVASDYRRIKSRTYRTMGEDTESLLPQLCNMILTSVMMRLKNNASDIDDPQLVAVLNLVMTAAEAIDPSADPCRYHEIEQEIQRLSRNHTYVGIPELFVPHTIDALKDLLVKMENYQSV